MSGQRDSSGATWFKWGLVRGSSPPPAGISLL